MPQRFKTGDVADAQTQQCSFADLGLREPLLKSLAEMGCEHPSPVQLRTIPAALAGSDVIVQAKSGTGKTIAFCSVVLHGVDTKLARTQGMVITPTREIALQVTDELTRMAWHIRPALNVNCFIGGMPLEQDVERIQASPVHVAVGSPGRTLRLLQDEALPTKLRFLVLDEADRLMEESFRDDILAITERVWNKRLQFLAFSATYPPHLVTATENLFVHVEKKRAKNNEPVSRELPKKIFLCTSAVKKDEQNKTVQNQSPDDVTESAVLRGVLHFRYKVQGYHVRQKLPALLEILTSVAYQQAFVFCNDPGKATQIAEMLSQSGIPAAATTGKMEQEKRTRAFAGLKRCQFRVLVCTDLMSRGIDVESADIVVNLDLPAEKETYLHRSGRTARFGSIGWNVNVVFEGDEDNNLSYFQMQLGFALADYADRDAVMAAHLEELNAPTEAALLGAASSPIELLQAPETLAQGCNVPAEKIVTWDVSARVEEGLDVGAWEEEDEEEEEEGEEEEEEEEFEEAEAEEEEEAQAHGHVHDGKVGDAWPHWQSAGLQASSGKVVAAASPDMLFGMASQMPTSAVVGQPAAQATPSHWVQANQRFPQPEQLPPSTWASAPMPVGAAATVTAATIASAASIPALPPPPVLFPPGGAQGLPPGVVRVLPQWEPWMLSCGTFAEFCARSPAAGAGAAMPGGYGAAAGYAGAHTSMWWQGGGVRERLEALWAHHRSVWTAV